MKPALLAVGMVVILCGGFMAAVTSMVRQKQVSGFGTVAVLQALALPSDQARARLLHDTGKALSALRERQMLDVASDGSVVIHNLLPRECLTVRGVLQSAAPLWAHAQVSVNGGIVPSVTALDDLSCDSETAFRITPATSQGIPLAPGYVNMDTTWE